MRVSKRWLLLTCAILAASACSDASEVEAPSDRVEPTGQTAQRLTRSFASGSLVIPMDTTYQDAGTLQAFGLVYALLRANVPVSWAIKPGKTQGAADFTASATDFVTAAPITNHGYRAGPFVVDSADAARAAPIITAWQASNTTTVHRTSAFTADVRKTLSAAPRIAVFVDGNEDIAFRYLNAARIPDSTGQAWPNGKLNNYATYPDVLSPAAIRGATTSGAADGALMRADGTPAYCQITSMHYASPADEEIVREVRLWLNSSLTHAFMECHATTAFENALGGHYLTTTGLVSDGNASPLANRVPDSPFTQFDGSFSGVGGSVASMRLAQGSTFYASDVTLMNQTTSPLTNKVVWFTGFLDGDTNKGKVSYLGGHEYPVKLPISANPTTNGVRLFLDSLFESNCADAEKGGEPKITFAKSAPASVSSSTMTYTLTYASSGPGIASNAVITDAVPAGATFVACAPAASCSHAGGVVTWNLGNLPAGASGSVSFDVTLPSNGSYSNQAKLDYKVFVTSKSILSNTVTTQKTSTPISDLAVSVVDSPDPVASGGAITYAITITNATGPQTAPDAVVTLTLPAGSAFSGSAGAGWTCSASGGVVTCTRSSSLPIGSTSQFTVTATAPLGPTTAKSTVSVSSTATDPAPASNVVEVSTTVVAASGDGGTDAGGGDAGALDSDGDGLPDVVERAKGLDPFDADSDDDGVPDGQEPLFDHDTDGDGLINALDPDSDDDGLFDGTEMGLDCAGKGTNAGRRRCVPDGDKGATKTDPLDADTDRGGVKDGSEDANLNGVVDSGETDPIAGRGSDDALAADGDKDGLGDALEKFLGSDPNDADSDDDGVIDGAEPNPSDDTDGDGLRNVLDADSDNDGLYDGTELGLSCANPATNAARNRCRADEDPTTKTSPLLRDTDRGGASDGSEDANLNGRVDPGEQDPTVGHGDDDEDVIDTDGDGLGDAVEATLGSNPNDADSDDDGLSDGKEADPAIDTDGDGKKNILDADSDDDALFDGTEAGMDCASPATDRASGTCIADADPTTTTGVLNPDTDRGGVKDGDEDANRDGKVDPGERDPNNVADDVLKGCKTDRDCTTGQACVDSFCVAGCRGEGGNPCSEGQVCSSTNATVGTCGPRSEPARAEDDGGFIEGGGCACRAVATTPIGGRRALGALALAVCLIVGRRRVRGGR